jgi:hypothetical protein
MDITSIISLSIGAAGVAVALYAAINGARIAAATKVTADATKISADANLAKTIQVEQSINGRLTAFIASIHAKAESDAMAAKSEAWLRESQAYSAGQENIRRAEPVATAAAVAELREVTVAAADAAKAALPAAVPP